MKQLNVKLITTRVHIILSRGAKKWLIYVKSNDKSICWLFFLKVRKGITDNYIAIANIVFVFNIIITEFIPINEFSWEYYISSSNTKQRKFEVFCKDDRGCLYPSFFKIQADGDDNAFEAKLVRSKTLYTNTPYLIIFTHQYYTLSFQNDEKVGKVINFRTMDRDFAGVVITFTNKTAQIEQQLETWKYKLEANETLTLLWPPSSQVDESMFISAKCAYILSSFEIRAHGNINVHSGDIVRLGDGISKISINAKTKVYKKNAGLMLDKHEGTTKPASFIYFTAFSATIGMSVHSITVSKELERPFISNSSAK